MSHGGTHEYLAFIAATAGWFAAGGLLGVVHFISLRWNVHHLVAGHVVLALGLQLLRFALTGTALTLSVRLFGAVPLLAGSLGLMAARTGVLFLELP